MSKKRSLPTKIIKKKFEGAFGVLLKLKLNVLVCHSSCFSPKLICKTIKFYFKNKFSQNKGSFIPKILFKIELTVILMFLNFYDF